MKVSQACIALALVAGCTTDVIEEQQSETRSQITTTRGITSAGGEIVGKRRGRRVQLGVGPAPGSGTGVAIDPAHYGMCGFIHVEGYFDAYANAEIVLDTNGYYAVDVYEGLTGRNGQASPSVDVECIFLSEFVGLPPNTSAVGSYDRMTEDFSTFVVSTPTTLPSACPWAGLSGAFSSPAHDFALSNAQWDWGSTLLSLSSSPALGPITSAAWCTNFGPEHPWRFVRGAAPAYDPAFGDQWLLGADGQVVKRDEAWCYLEGIARLVADPLPTEFDINVLTLLDGSAFYRHHVSSTAAMWWNCVKLDQH